MFSFLIRSSYFEVVISFKPFNSTGAISISSNHFNGVSFEWALTHRSFPRILPDSSNSFQSYSQIHCKVWRKNELSSVKCLSSNSFIVGSTFLIVIPECLNNSWWFSSSFSTFEDRRRVSLQSYPFSWRFLVLALCHPLIIVFDCENSFHRSGAFHELFPFLSSEGHHVIILHPQLVAIVLQILSMHRPDIL